MTAATTGASSRAGRPDSLHPATGGTAPAMFLAAVPFAQTNPTTWSADSPGGAWSGGSDTAARNIVAMWRYFTTVVGRSPRSSVKYRSYAHSTPRRADWSVANSGDAATPSRRRYASNGPGPAVSRPSPARFRANTIEVYRHLRDGVSAEPSPHQPPAQPSHQPQMMID